ncbi:uncharacterized protein F4812DRAFT_93419 [Daldinia caldariorum]|uniref:uncharacterized protein n=1 Tax=Daldinia caldariorum TaxID=326644 RepID=UPI002007D766|nr:uncharacterized protein F4812DRAFT_93419 [Daldinia caldariorum]KAI1466016.1 hypothetical protein F4812DRAFT_93419 [Daldinia caldariorum]
MTDQGALNSPESLDTPMERHVQAARMVSLDFGQHPDGFLERMAVNIAALSTGRQPADSFAPGRIENRLALWYHRNDGPWTPAGLMPSPGNIRNSSLLRNLRNVQFPLYGLYRDNPSECDTVPPAGIPSDSGYGGSHAAKHSVANSSVYNEPIDRNQELLGDANFLSHSQDIASRISAETPWSQSQPPSTSPQSAIALQATPDGGKVCEICGKVSKTKSEFKKHKQRHDKPFKCIVKGCTRREGFSTPNDLDRHKRSLHPGEDAVGDRYRCQVGPCANKDKIWPRADNFRAHMKRVHKVELLKDEDLDQYKCRPEALPKDTSSVAPNTAASEINMSNIFPDIYGNDISDNWESSQGRAIDKSDDTTPPEGPNEVQVEGASSVIELNEDRPDEYNGNTAQVVLLKGKDAPFETQTEMPSPLSSQPGPSLGDLEPTKAMQLREDEPTFHPEILGPELVDDSSTLSHQQADAPDEPRARPSELTLGSLEPNVQPERLMDDSEKSDVSAEPKDRGQQKPNLEDPEFVSKIFELIQDKNPEFFLKILEQIQDKNPELLLKVLELIQNKGMLDAVQKFGRKKDDSQETDMARQEAANDIAPQTHVCPQCKKPFGRRCELRKHEKRHLKPYGCTFKDCKKTFGSKNDWKRHENSQHVMLEHWICDEKQADNPTEPCGKNFSRWDLFKQHLSASHNIEAQEYLDRKLETCRIGRNSETRFWCGFCQHVIEGGEARIARYNHIDDHFQGRNNQTKRDISHWISLEDDSIVSSESASSSNNPDTQSSSEAEKPRTEVSNHKRKRGNDLDLVASQRTEMILIVCVCGVPSPCPVCD